MEPPKSALTLHSIIETAFREDVRDGDHTSLATIGPGPRGTARLLVKEPGILAGVDAALEVLRYYDKSMEVEVYLGDGSAVRPGDIAFHVSGSALSILTSERIVLNMMQRMSGIATKTARYVEAVRGTGTTVIDTRKTTPGIRLLEKWAVGIGGGGNHRMGLYDMIMIKDNHVDFCGGIAKAIRAVADYQQRKGMSLKVEIETRDLDEVRQVLDSGGVDRIMLDNFQPDALRAAVELIGGRYETEASGGITLESIRSFAETGVDYISSGALTHSAVSMDLSLKAIVSG